MHNLGKLLIGEKPLEMLKCDLKLEHEAIPQLRDALLIVRKLKIMSPEKFLNTSWRTS